MKNELVEALMMLAACVVVVFAGFFLTGCAGNVDTLQEAHTATACPNPDPKSAIYCDADEILIGPDLVVCTWACALHLTTAGSWSASFQLVDAGRPQDPCWEGPAFKRLGDCAP